LRSPEPVGTPRRTTANVPALDGHGRPLVDADELAARLGKTRRAIYRLIEDHGLPAIKLGRSLAFDLEAVDQWLERRRVGDWTDDEGPPDLN
jgi:excisionase family DNA binding protein